MNNDKSMDAIQLPAFPTGQPLNISRTDLMINICSSLSSFGKELAKTTQQIDWSKAFAPSLSHINEMSQFLVKDIDCSAILRQFADRLQAMNLQETLDLTKVINQSFSHCLSNPIDISSLYNHKVIDSAAVGAVINSCVSTLKTVEPFMPEKVTSEIQKSVVAPSEKKKTISIDTLLNIIGIVLTVLFFVYEQVSSSLDQQKTAKQIDVLCESNQQLVDEIGELSRTIQQLSDQICKLSDHLDSSDEILLNSQDIEQ